MILPTPTGEQLRIREGFGPCQVHDWPEKGLATRLVAAMRASHPTGINACRDCIDRAKRDADRARGRL